MELSGRTAQERFLRGGRPGARGSGHKARKILRLLFTLGVLGAMAAGAFWGAALFGRSPVLRVQRVLVEGNERLSDGEILELLALAEDANILTLDLEEVRRKLLRSAWVRDVTLKRILPGTLTLEIAERTPVAIAVLGDLYLLAEDGTVLDQLSPQYDIAHLVLARGLLDGGGLSSERAAMAGRLALALSRDERLAPMVSELDVSAGKESVAVRLRDPAVTLLVSEQTMMERLHEVVTLLGGILERFPRLEAVDLRFRGRVYLKNFEPTPDEKYTRAEFVLGGVPF